MIAHTWNTDRETLPSGSVRSRISGRWKNYIRRKQVWEPINTDLQSDRSVTAFPGCLQLPESSQGWAEICIDGTFSMKRHIEEGNGNNAEPDFEMSLAVETQHNITGHISETNPAQMVYPDAWDAADLKLGIWRGRSARIEKVVEIKSMPSGNSEFVEYAFLIQSNSARVLAGADHTVSPWDESGHAELNNADAFVSLSGSQLRGAVLRTPVAWYYVDGEMVRVPVLVTFDIQSDGETVRATKHIPRTLITTALAAGSHLFTDATFDPDAHPETSSVDGYVERFSAESWSSLTSGAGTNSNDNSSNSLQFRISNDGSGNPWQVQRPIFTFDTSSIGSGQQIDSGTVEITYGIMSDSAGYSSNFTAALVASTPASTTSITDADYSQLGSTELATGRHAYGTTGARTFTLNASGLANVDPEGDAKFGIRDGYYDLDGNTPSGTAGEYIRYEPRSSEHGDAAELDVTHSAASSFNAGYTVNANPEGN